MVLVALPLRGTVCLAHMAWSTGRKHEHAQQIFAGSAAGLPLDTGATSLTLGPQSEARPGGGHTLKAISSPRDARLERKLVCVAQRHPTGAGYRLSTPCPAGCAVHE
jgi:hypothetical protein